MHVYPAKKIVAVAGDSNTAATYINNLIAGTDAVESYTDPKTSEVFHIYFAEKPINDSEKQRGQAAFITLWKDNFESSPAVKPRTAVTAMPVAAVVGPVAETVLPADELTRLKVELDALRRRVAELEQENTALKASRPAIATGNLVASGIPPARPPLNAPPPPPPPFGKPQSGAPASPLSKAPPPSSKAPPPPLQRTIDPEVEAFRREEEQRAAEELQKRQREQAEDRLIDLLYSSPTDLIAEEHVQAVAIKNARKDIADKCKKKDAQCTREEKVIAEKWWKFLQDQQRKELNKKMAERRKALGHDE